MADKPKETGEEEVKKKGGSPLPFLLVGVIGVALGVAVPMLIPAAEAPADEPDRMEERKIDLDAEFVESKAKYLPFNGGDSVVVNLNDERMSRFLSVGFSLKVSEDSDLTEEDLTKKGPPLMSWLIANLSANSLEDVRGKAGQNRIRREIRDQFNSMLFPDGHDRIFDILFNNFAVQ
jgi:flagellar FliL protein